MRPSTSWERTAFCKERTLSNRIAINWMFVFPPEFICGNFIPRGMVFRGGAFGRWLGHEDGALMNGISVLMKETSENSLAPSTVWGHRGKTDSYEPGIRPSPDTKSPGTLMLDFPAFRTVRSKCLLFKLCRLSYFCYNSLNGLRQGWNNLCRSLFYCSKCLPLYIPAPLNLGRAIRLAQHRL